MKKHLLILTIVCGAAWLSAENTFAQMTDASNKPVNFRYSRNPKTKGKTAAPNSQSSAQNAPVGDSPINTSDDSVIEKTVQPEENSSIAKKTLEIAKRANSASIMPTEVYKVGAGDVLFINLQNVSKASSYFTILNDGTIDYPLSGEMISVAGLTVEEIEDLLKEKIKLYENPQVSVKVRDYASHSINVLGLVEKAGERKIQREAVPLFVVKADALVQPRADQVIVRRVNSTIETLDLKNSKTEEVLIFPGDIVEFAAAQKSESAKSDKFYFIGGEINAGGQKDYHQGITLTQAILASGGLRRLTVKKIVIRRKNADGLLVSTEYNLKNIKDGKEPDPVLQSDDTVEIGL